MELKKNPKYKVDSNSSLYFALGLIIMLFITYNALEYKTFDVKDLSADFLFMDDELEDEIPVTEQIVTPPPPPSPQAAPEIITIVEDIMDVEETLIESSETNQEEAVVERVINVEDVEIEELEEDVSVPFSVVEKIPVFPGCNQTTNEELKNCFQKKMQEHVLKHFKYPEEAIENGVTGKVYVWFEVNTSGIISNIRTRGPDKLIEKEAARIVSLLPKMKPGEQRGKPVKVPYALPVMFHLQD